MPLIISVIIALIFSALLSGVASGYSESGAISFQFSAWQTTAGTLSALLALITYKALNTITPSEHQQEVTADGRHSGTVKWFNPKKGFGFISCSSGDEVFVHYRNIEGSGRRVLREGESVTFLIVQSDKGPQAEDVRSEN